eukprot:4331736-Pyramimonas_sp.AAC.1
MVRKPRPARMEDGVWPACDTAYALRLPCAGEHTHSLDKVPKLIESDPLSNSLPVDFPLGKDYMDKNQTRFP